MKLHTQKGKNASSWLTNCNFFYLGFSEDVLVEVEVGWIKNSLQNQTYLNLM